ncbi:MAG: hypothetical protein COS85_21115 [Armatimonadetes bacterium CG07_land_8_20_14_0_80_59_28]|nr:MAG: hypothetical protein COS85_21115 [Armatimonadetes bacterium CG07_land_8_20_14_0_80_59_28]PIX45053.1 MAG: hypothetical protein COZ56_02850 [Armatimonadetes bacterium CG_4_8_14_3_um_filter_58_9]PJB75801.1 MAG: hypothetical protein CO095_03370 [Armatimonadetes bacterium CG_4_9_14_3_um_filter_58_7]
MTVHEFISVAGTLRRLKNQLRREGVRLLPRLVWHLYLCLMRKVNGGRPVPVSTILRWHQAMTIWTSVSDPLSPVDALVISDGGRYPNPCIADLLSGVELGGWALSSATMGFLEAEIGRRPPHAVLEFGCGISTLFLAFLMDQLNPSMRGALVFSVEQCEEYLQQTRGILKQHSLEHRVKLLKAPLKPQTIAGFDTFCYDLCNSIMADFVEDSRPDFVLIDGPASASPACRFGTLPLVKDFLCRESRFFLDDALRDEEIGIAGLWSRYPRLDVSGLVLVGRGLLTGELRP